MAMTLASRASDALSRTFGYSSAPSATESNPETSMAVFDPQRLVETARPATPRLALTAPGTATSQLALTAPANGSLAVVNAHTSQLGLLAPERQPVGWVLDGSVDSDGSESDDDQQDVIRYEDPRQDPVVESTSPMSAGNLKTVTTQLTGTGGKWGGRMIDWNRATADGEPDQSPYGALAVIDQDTQALIADARNTNEGTELQLMADPPSENEEFKEEAKLTADDRIERLTASIRAEQESLFKEHRSILEDHQRRLGNGNGSQDTIIPSECDPFPLLSPIRSQKPPQAFPARRAPSIGSDGTLFEDDITVFFAQKPTPAHGLGRTQVDEGRNRMQSMQPSRSLVPTERSYIGDRGAMTKNTRFQSFLPSRGHRDPGATAAFKRMREDMKTLAAQRYKAQRDASQQQLVNTVLSALAPRLDDYISACVTAGVQMPMDQQLARQSSFAPSPGPIAFSPFSYPFGAPPSIFSQSPSRYLAEPVIQTTVVFGAPGAGQSYGAGYQSQAYTNPYASYGRHAGVSTFANPSVFSQYGHGQYRQAPQQFDPYGGVAGGSSFAPESLFGNPMASQPMLTVGY